LNRVTILFLGFLLAIPSVVHAGQKMVPSVDPDGNSSLPPIPGLYDCVRSLRGQPYAERKTQDCLHSIVGHGHIEAGRIETSRDEYGVEVHFVLRAPALRLAEVDLGIPPEWQKQFDVATQANAAILHVGDYYDTNREVLTAIALEQLLSANGVEGYVSRRLYLDYSTQIAKVVYRIWKGPMGSAQQLPPPFGEDCHIYRKTFLLTDIDDRTPLPLIKRLSETSSSFCFSDSLVRNDERRLSESGLFTTAEFSVTGTGDSRDVSLKIRAKVLTVEKVDVDGYGLITTSDLANPPLLPLRAGQKYSRSAALGSQVALEQVYARLGRRVKVSEEDAVLPNGKLKVTLHVVSAPDDELFIDGQKIPTAAS
jgi:hypothetical protein